MEGRQGALTIGRPVKPIVAPSQGMRIVVERDFLASDHALMVPKTADGRVLFTVPWLGKLIPGTTDSPRRDIVREPEPFSEEVAFILVSRHRSSVGPRWPSKRIAALHRLPIRSVWAARCALRCAPMAARSLRHLIRDTTLEESARYLTRAPKIGDIRSIRVGLRPLVKPQDDEGDNTKSLRREHTVLASRSGLVTEAGASEPPTAPWPRMCCKNASLRGCCRKSPQGRPTTCPWWARPRGRGGGEHRISQAQGLHSYGSDAAMVQGLPGADIDLGGGLSAATVRFAACHGYACTVEDMLARRSRLLFLDARQAIEPAPAVAHSCCARNWAPIRGSTRSWPSRNGICMPPPNFALDFSKALCQNRWLRSKERNFCPAGSAANGLRRGRRAQDWLADLPPLRGSRGLLSFGASWEH